MPLTGDVHRYARHAERFGDPRTVYETARRELSMADLLALGRRLVKLDPGEYRDGRRTVKWPRFTWRWAYGFHVRRARYQVIKSEPWGEWPGLDTRLLDCSHLGPWGLGLLFSDSPSAAISPPDGIWVQIAQTRSGRALATGGFKAKSRTRPPVPALGERFGRLVVERALKRDDGRTWLLCNCDCGGSTLAKPSHLRRGEVTSCGCKRREEGRLRLFEVEDGTATRARRQAHPGVGLRAAAPAPRDPTSGGA
jgi:hypothetical protein